MCTGRATRQQLVNVNLKRQLNYRFSRKLCIRKPINQTLETQEASEYGASCGGFAVLGAAPLRSSPVHS
jgi:hypothetical protein